MKNYQDHNLVELSVDAYVGNKERILLNSRGQVEEELIFQKDRID